jgi:hypothetical protein
VGPIGRKSIEGDNARLLCWLKSLTGLGNLTTSTSLTHAQFHSHSNIPPLQSTKTHTAPDYASLIYSLWWLDFAYWGALQMKGQWASNINVWLWFMYSQNWNCAASLFPEKNYNVLSPNFHINVSLSERFIYSQDWSAYLTAAEKADWSWEYIYKSLTDTWM